MKPLMRVWRWVRWPVGVLVLVYIALVLYRIPTVGEKERTKDAVAYIHAQKITLSDVMGSNLPPPPNKQENDATVDGVDTNNNGIRDDVELAIFEKYPDSPRVRAAQLQYAMALQMELTKVFNSETWKAAAIESSRGFACISETHPRTDLKEYINITDARTKEVNGWMLNTPLRQTTRDRVYEFAVTYGLPNADLCNINLDTLQS